MTAGLKPYLACRDSGVEWLGKVPAHWEVRRLKNWLRINRSALSEKTGSDYEFDYLDIGSAGTGRLTNHAKRIRFGVAPVCRYFPNP